MTIYTTKSFLDDALKYVSQEAKYHVTDALYCHFHNAGQTLVGSTEENDVEWFARIMWEHPDRRHGERWDIELDAVKDEYRKFAELALRNMSKIQSRMANRLIELSKVMQDWERAEREATDKMKRKR